MKIKLIFVNILFSMVIANSVFAAEIASIQRIDIANVLATTGGAQKATVTLDFKNGDLIPCYTTTLAYQGAATIFAGPGQVCVSPITTITVTPIASPGDLGILYDRPDDFTISDILYYTQMSINQNTSPQFDPRNGAVLKPGTVIATITANING